MYGQHAACSKTSEHRIEGLAHPEAVSGPDDNRMLFGHFAALVDSERARKRNRAFDPDAQADLVLAAGCCHASSCGQSSNTCFYADVPAKYSLQ